MVFHSVKAAAYGQAVLLSMLLCSTTAWGQDSLVLRKIKETGVISLGFRDGSIPFSYLDDKQRPIGYSMDLCYRIVDAVKARLKLASLQLKFTPVNSATRLPLVANHAIDLECGTTTNTVERQKQISFVVTTFVASSRWASRRADGIEKIADLRGRTVVSTAGTTSIRYLAELNEARKLQMNILAGRDHAESFRMVETGRADAFVMDDVLLYGLVATSRTPTAFSISKEALSVEPYGIGLPKDDPAFKQLADETIIGLFRSGEIREVFRKWFQSSIPPSHVNLQLPMPPALARVIERPTDSGDPADYR